MTIPQDQNWPGLRIAPVKENPPRGASERGGAGVILKLWCRAFPGVVHGSLHRQEEVCSLLLTRKVCRKVVL